MTDDFANKIKKLESEIEALKTVRTKSSTVLETKTVTVDCYAQLYCYATTLSNVQVVKKSALIKIKPKSGEGFIYSWALQSWAQKQRRIDIFPWFFDDGNVGLAVQPSVSSVDSSMAVGSYKTITMTVYITATDDFTTEVSQIIEEN